jgi:hypothetical protein
MAYISFQPKDYFNTKLWTGTGSTNAVTGVGFQPDMIWIKNRSTSANNNLFDAIRGATKRIYPDDTSAEVTATDSLTSFDSDGFTLGNGSPCNGSGNSIVGWNWKANGQGSANTDGTINTTYTSANTTSGFSICKWTGTGSAGTIGHGLGAVPSMIIFKNLDGSSSRMWAVYHKGVYVSASDPNILYLNTTNAQADDTNVLGTSVTLSSSVFSVGDYAGSNYSGEDIIAYCFAEKKGFSKFGSYTGNGEASDNAFIYTGFKPAFILIKATDVDEWRIYDNKRANPFNVIDVRLKANSSDAESSGNNECDFLSNGVKIRSNSGGVGSSGQTYIYMAFAEEPLVASNGTPATAR